MVNRLCCFWACGEAETSWRKRGVMEGCSPHGSQEACESQGGPGTRHSPHDPSLQLAPLFPLPPNGALKLAPHQWINPPVIQPARSSHFPKAHQLAANLQLVRTPRGPVRAVTVRPDKLRAQRPAAKGVPPSWPSSSASSPAGCPSSGSRVTGKDLQDGWRRKRVTVRLPESPGSLHIVRTWWRLGLCLPEHTGA